MKSRYLVACLAATLLGACSGKEAPTDIPCTDQQYWDHVNEECVERFRGDNASPDMSGSDDEVDADMGGGSSSDGGDEDPPDMATRPDMEIIDPECDKDGDGALSIACGGNDCDDEDPRRSPNNPEFCDHIDNDCDGVNNEGLNCTFYAHSGQTLYAIDPFEKTATELSTDLPGLLDIDTHPNGTLLGVSYEGLFEYDDLRNNWWQVGEFGRNVEDPNGMAIDSAGEAFVTSQDEIYTVDIVSGEASLLGNLGSNYYSSGDCVVNKRDSLYMTSKHDEATDWLLLVSRANGSATEVGPIGFTKVFALTAAWGILYGLTDRGELIEIDSNTGEGTLIHQFENIRFFGAASTPSR